MGVSSSKSYTLNAGSLVYSVLQTVYDVNFAAICTPNLLGNQLFALDNGYYMNSVTLNLAGCDEGDTITVYSVGGALPVANNTGVLVVTHYC